MRLDEIKTRELADAPHFGKQTGRRLLLGFLVGGLLSACREPQLPVDLVRDEPVIDSADIIKFPHPLFSPEAVIVRLMQLSVQPQFQGAFRLHPSGRVTKQQIEAVKQNSFREKGFEVTNLESEKKRFAYLQQNPTYNGALDNKNWPVGNIRSARYSLTLDQNQIWSNFNLYGLTQLDQIPAIKNKVYKKFGANGGVIYDLLPETLCEAAFNIGVLPTQTEQLIVPANPGSTDHCDISGTFGNTKTPVTMKFSMYQSGSWRLQLTGANYITRP